MPKTLALIAVIGLIGCKSSAANKETNKMEAPASTFAYFEIVTKDVEKTRDSYAKTFGWKFELVPEFGNAFVATLPDGGRCGIRAPMRPDEGPLVRTYIRVTDVAKATKLAEESGGHIALPPTEIPGHGKFAIYLLGGIEQGIWQIP